MDPPGPVWTCTELAPPPGFDPWTVQPVAIRLLTVLYRPTPIHNHIHTHTSSTGLTPIMCFRQHVQAKAEYPPVTVPTSARNVPRALQYVSCFLLLDEFIAASHKNGSLPPAKD